ncbi:MAG: PDZ domain-containing protein [Elusimicrobiota bacterium]|nr:PDZ domain-containing protein [Elusimicrobiota bacterium]
MKDDSMDMLENGYLLIGKSTFKSPPLNEEQALDQAKKVGADIVLTKKEYVGTVTESVPMTEYLPDRRNTTRAQSTYQTNPSALPSIAITEVTQTISGESYIQYVPKSTDYFNYSATFWKKTKPPIFGVLARNLDEETKKRLQTNRGVIVKVVVRKTPAFNADILRDDIITQFNGQSVTDPEDFFDKIKTHAGQQVTVKVIRDGTLRDITLTLLAK